MAGRRLTAEEVLNRIIALDADDSGDETDNDSVDGEQEEQPAPNDLSDDEEVDEVTEVRTTAGRDGTQWTVIDGVPRGRLERHNVFTARVRD